MMKLLIAEDEALALGRLKAISWETVGVELTAVATDGLAALEMAKSQKPDIIITDIKMPRLDGIQLAEKISTLLPDVKIIILSAYPDFNYAQRAISSGVSEYILKPFTADTLINAVKKVTEELIESQNRMMRVEKMMSQLDISKVFMKNYFFGNIDKGDRDKAFISIFGDFPMDAAYIVVVISVENLAETIGYEESYKLFCEISKLAAKKLDKHSEFFEINQFVYIFAYDKKMEEKMIVNTMMEISELFKEYILFSFEGKFTIGVGKCVYTPEEIILSYQSALDAIKYWVYLGEDNVIYISDLEPNSPNYNHYKIYEKTLFDYIRVGDVTAASQVLNTIFDTFVNNREDVNYVQRVCYNIIANLSMCFVQCDQSPDILFNKSDVWAIVREYNDIDELRRFINKIIDVAIYQISSSRESKNNTMVEEVKEYIRSNLSASLVQIAEHFHISANYLSRIFSKNAGVTIKNYLIQERIRYAKDMLRNTDKSMNEIAAEMGYSPKHFSVMFKQATGKNPVAFREGRKE